MRKQSVAVVLLAALVLAGSALASYRQPELERASAAIGVAATVRCASRAEVKEAMDHSSAPPSPQYELSGWAIRELRAVYLAPRTCGWLRSRQNTPSYALGLAVLAHELGHIALDTSGEKAAECFGQARWRRLGRALGLEYATELQLAAVQELHRSTPPRYRGACS